MFEFCWMPVSDLWCLFSYHWSSVEVEFWTYLTLDLGFCWLSELELMAKAALFKPTFGVSIGSTYSWAFLSCLHFPSSQHSQRGQIENSAVTATTAAHFVKVQVWMDCWVTLWDLSMTIWMLKCSCRLPGPLCHPVELVKKAI